MLTLRKPSPDTLRRTLDEQQDLAFSYQEVGATAATLPPGFHHDRFVSDLGVDEGNRFSRAREAVFNWVAQRSAGIELFPDQPVEAHLTFVLVLRLPVAGWAIAPARVCYVVDEVGRAGFAYGTLPGHPERGEEAFVVAREEGRVVYRVIAFSRPRDPLARLGAPVTRALQVRTIRSYLRAMEAAAR